MFDVASCDCSANFLISSATTANPLPFSPTLAASIAALSANKLVCSEISVISVTIFSISFELLLTFSMLLFISSVTFTAVLELSTRLLTVFNPNLVFSSKTEQESFIFINEFETSSIIVDNSSVSLTTVSVSFACSFETDATSSIVKAI